MRQLPFVLRSDRCEIDAHREGRYGEVLDQSWYPGKALDTSILVEQGGMTTLTATVLYESRDAVLKSFMGKGVAASYDRLAEILVSSPAGGVEERRQVRVSSYRIPLPIALNEAVNGNALTPRASFRQAEGGWMKTILVLLGSSLGGWAGWVLGEHFGMMAAFMVSMVGTALGVYAARWFIREYAG